MPVAGSCAWQTTLLASLQLFLDCLAMLRLGMDTMLEESPWQAILKDYIDSR